MGRWVRSGGGGGVGRLGCHHNLCCHANQRTRKQKAHSYQEIRVAPANKAGSMSQSAGGFGGPDIEEGKRCMHTPRCCLKTKPNSAESAHFFF